MDVDKIPLSLSSGPGAASLCDTAFPFPSLSLRLFRPLPGEGLKLSH